MIPQPILDNEAALRLAVEQRQFSRVQNLALSYSGLADAWLSTLPPRHPARLDHLTRVVGLLKWTHLMLCTARAGYSGRLRLLLLAKRYSASPGRGERLSRPSVVHIDL